MDIGALGVLSREACLCLLGTAALGRVAVSAQALPLIVPVHFDVDDDQIVIATEAGSMLDSATCDTVVAFEADGRTAVSRRGWCVHVSGIARHVTNPFELERLGALARPLVDDGSRLVVISTDQLSGWLADDTDVPVDHDGHAA